MGEAHQHEIVVVMGKEVRTIVPRVVCCFVRPTAVDGQGLVGPLAGGEGGSKLSLQN